MRFVFILFFIASSHAGELVWPIDCVVGKDCSLGYPDTDGDGRAHNCAAPGYRGHQGTDIMISQRMMDDGTNVYAAAEGVVLWVFDGKYDRCPDRFAPDCQPSTRNGPGTREGNTVCTEMGPYCGAGGGRCYWCFAGGNVIVIRHENIPGVFATRYDHLRRGSIIVAPGESVRQGQVIAKVGSAGHSSGPHLHFEVWGKGYYDLADPWAGKCGPNTGPSLWKYPEQPWFRK